jgi:DNA-binding PadR family transcriptional regulator
VITLLAERPMHGYEIIQELAERTGGLWKPSPGSVYPTLQLLEDEGHVLVEQDGGKRRFSLTESGRAVAAELAGKKAPWDEVNEGADPEVVRLRQATGQLIAAVYQIGHAGTPAQQSEAETILGDARRRLYAILAAEA